MTSSHLPDIEAIPAHETKTKLDELVRRAPVSILVPERSYLSDEDRALLKDASTTVQFLHTERELLTASQDHHRARAERFKAMLQELINETGITESDLPQTDNEEQQMRLPIHEVCPIDRPLLSISYETALVHSLTALTAKGITKSDPDSMFGVADWFSYVRSAKRTALIVNLTALSDLSGGFTMLFAIFGGRTLSRKPEDAPPSPPSLCNGLQRTAFVIRVKQASPVLSPPSPPSYSSSLTGTVLSALELIRSDGCAG